HDPVLHSFPTRRSSDLTPLRRWQDDIRTVVLYMDGVPVIDSAGAVTLVSAIEEYLSRGVQVIIADLLPEPRKVLQRSGLLTQQRSEEHTSELQSRENLV